MVITRRSALASAAVAGALGLIGCAPEAKPDGGATSAAPVESATPSPTPTPTAPADPLPEGIVNAIVIGTDAREKTDFGGNTDVLMLAQISADRSKLTLVSIARDTYLGGSKANAAYPGGGMSRLKQVVSDAFGGLDIHLTAHTNFNGFISITRALKGIRVFNRHANTTTVISTGREVVFPEGEILLENTDALIYARERKSLPQGDLDRAERHRALMTGMIKGLQAWYGATPNTFTKLVQGIAGMCYYSGVEKEQIPDLVTPLMKIDANSITSLMLPLSGFDTVGGQSVNIVDTAKAAELGEALRNGDVAPYVQKYGTDYTPGQ